MPIRTSKYDAPTLRKLRGTLSRIISTVDEAISIVDESGEPLWVFKAHSQEEGLRRLNAFHDELIESVIAAQSGSPQHADTLKPRANAPAKGRSSRQEEQAAVDREAAELEAKEAKTRHAAKPSKGADQAKGRRKKSG